jgi:hypothetical protein
MVDEFADCELATGDDPATPAADWLTLQFSVGIRYMAGQY